MSAPQITAVPALGARKPVAIFIVVDLPAPLGPRNPSTSPRETVNDTSSTATKAPKFLERLRISSIPTPARCGQRTPQPVADHDSKPGTPPIPRLRLWRRPAMIRRIRLASGLVMLAYVAMHLLNHALGLVSIPAMGWALNQVVYPFWSFPPMQLALYGAFLVHYTLALWALWQRQTLRLRGSETLQLVLGFMIPILIARHVVGTRISDSFFGTYNLYYRYVLWVYFVGSPAYGLLQLATLVIAWTHAMLGLHFWLRIRRWYGHWRELGLTVAVLVPVLALLGTIEAGREIVALDADPTWRARAFAQMRLPTAETEAALARITDALTWFFIMAVLMVLLARIARHAWRRRHGLIRIAYPNGRVVDVVKGTSVLEASRLARIPHASICGGRGRCSTCRVRVRAAYPGLPAPNDDEQRVLNRIRAMSNVRLACMLRPEVEVQVTPLLPPLAQAADGLTPVDVTQG